MVESVVEILCPHRRRRLGRGTENIRNIRRPLVTRLAKDPEDKENKHQDPLWGLFL